MIKNILKLLSYSDYLGESENIEIAKGKYKIPFSVLEAYKQFKRDLKWL